MAAWWGVGQMVSSLVAWPFMANFSCERAENCTNANNSGWRYTFYTLGGFVLILSILRMVVIRLKESPKWLLSQNRDAEVVEIIEEIARAAGKQSPLTIEQLNALGLVNKGAEVKKYNPMIIVYHIKGECQMNYGDPCKTLNKHRSDSKPTRWIFNFPQHCLVGLDRSSLSTLQCFSSILLAITGCRCWRRFHLHYLPWLCHHQCMQHFRPNDSWRTRGNPFPRPSLHNGDRSSPYHDLSLCLHNSAYGGTELGFQLCH